MATTTTNVQQVLSGLDQLTADEIRGRIADLAAEDKALRLILRAKLQAARQRERIAPEQSRRAAQ
jgi:hypothetical protein